VEFRVLGPLEVVDEGRAVEPGGPRQRALIGYLLAHANEVVATDRLIEDLWGGSASGANAVQVTVSRLRKALGAEDRLQTQPSGYVLRVARGECDRDRFEQLYADARRLLEQERAGEAAKLLREALALWRGPPFSEFRYEPFAQAEIARLEELRLGCLEARIDADLALARHTELVSELEALTREHPLRQRLRAQLMLALYRCGRHADALDVYQETRRRLVDELGIEPGGELRELHQAILRQDAELEAPEPEAPEAHDPPAEPLPLPLEDARQAEDELPATPSPVRKTVTVLVSGIAGQVDPEVRHRLGERLLAHASPTLERHGAAVERLGADRVVGVFGVPSAHEDDALRAVRAAVELRADFLARGERFCIGIDTGRMLTGDSEAGEPLVTGDAIDIAVQLQQAGKAGWICIGETTRRLVLDAVMVEEAGLPPGSRETGTQSAWRLLELLPDTPAFQRRFDASFVGREAELTQLRQALGRATRERRAHLATVFGDAGIGKTRLAQELGRALDGHATLLTGRCLSYGEGITYWPVREIVIQAVGERDVRVLLDGNPDADIVAARLEGAIGAGTAGAVNEEVFWAMRRFVESLARELPLVLAFEDVHWAEPTLLDLIEHLADWVRDAPVLIVCLARPELLDGRPAWAGGKLNTTSILLEPLTEDESAELMEDLAAEGTLAPVDRARITSAAAGNPLYLEQMLAMLADTGPGVTEIAAPPAIQALLAARLDRLEPDERTVLACASIEGEIFHVGGVAELMAPETREDVPTKLMSLVRKELIRFEPPDWTGDDAFRFRHALIRDAAYEGLPKETRSELHRRHAAWLERATSDRADEYEEFLGYHLEQALRYRTELTGIDDDALALADQARLHLTSAGRRAFRRGDIPAVVNLLERARALPASDDRALLELAPDVGFALFHSGQLERAEIVLSDAIERGRALGHHQLERRAWLVWDQVRRFKHPELIDIDAAQQRAEESLAAFQEAGDDLALGRAWQVLWDLHQSKGVPAVQEDAADRGRQHARRAGSRLDEARSLASLGRPVLDGPTPANEAIAKLGQLLDELGGDPLGTAIVEAYLAPLVAMQGRFDEGRELVRESSSTMDEFGLSPLRTMIDVLSGRVEMLAGDPVAAERVTREGTMRSIETADTWFYALSSVDLARAVCEQGRPSECIEILDESERRPSPPDRELVVERLSARALALGKLGKVDEAERIAREAVGQVEGTEFLGFHADSLVVLAGVIDLAGRYEEAVAPYEAAVALYERKGNVVSAGRVRAELDALKR
jgi:DNA-binding SARP family transcriptional activator/class 3 adenylate cyclase